MCVCVCVCQSPKTGGSEDGVAGQTGTLPALTRMPGAAAAAPTTPASAGTASLWTRTTAAVSFSSLRLCSAVKNQFIIRWFG